MRLKQRHRPLFDSSFCLRCHIVTLQPRRRVALAALGLIPDNRAIAAHRGGEHPRLLAVSAHRAALDRDAGRDRIQVLPKTKLILLVLDVGLPIWNLGFAAGRAHADAGSEVANDLALAQRHHDQLLIRGVSFACSSVHASISTAPHSPTICHGKF